MRTRVFLTIILIAITMMQSACGGTTDPVDTSQGTLQESGSEKPVLGTNHQANCYSKPGLGYKVVSVLDASQFFEIIGIDDDITWIDDDITWFQINPNAVVDPNPPHRPLNELSPQPDPPGSQTAVRCWIARDSVQYKGDLSQVPVVTKPVLGMHAEMGCHSGPGVDFDVVLPSDAGSFFDIVGIDDDITWIDDDITWFQINPNALVDPNPPHRPLNELSPQPDPPGSQMVVRCWLPGDGVETEGDLSGVPVIAKPIVEVLATTACHSGPSVNFEVLRTLDTDSFFDIVGIDDDITWIDDDITWIDDDITWIDDDITWFQVDPTALIDPEPPHRPLNAGASQSGTSGSSMAMRCWLPRGSVRFSGDLGRVPVIVVPLITPTPRPKQPTPVPPPPPPSINCGAYTSYTECMQHSNFGCAWDSKRSICYKK